MNDKNTITGFVLIWLMMILSIVLTITFASPNVPLRAYVQEHGLVEMVTVMGYLVALLLILYKGGLDYIRGYFYFVIAIAFFMLRELDLDKELTTMGIFKSRFYSSESVPWYEKIAGAGVIILLLYSLYIMTRHHLGDLWRGLKKAQMVSIGAMMVIILLVMSKGLDGIARKLEDIGIQIGGTQIPEYAMVIEEVLEMGIPFFIIVSYLYYFHTSSQYDTAKPT